MSDRIFLALMAVTAVAMILFAAVWPQGLGARSPGPFGHTPLQQTPAMQAAMAREAAKAEKKFKTQREAAAAQLRRVTTPQPTASSGASVSSAAAAASALPALRPDQ